MAKIRIIDLEKENTSQEIIDNKSNLYIAVDSVENGTSKCSLENLQDYITEIVQNSVTNIINNTNIYGGNMDNPKFLLPISKSKFYQDEIKDIGSWSSDKTKSDVSLLDSIIKCELKLCLQIRIRYKAVKKDVGAGIKIICVDTSGESSLVDEIYPENTTEIFQYERWFDCDEGVQFDVRITKPDTTSTWVTYWDADARVSILRYSDTDFSTGDSEVLTQQNGPLMTATTYTVPFTGTLYVYGYTNYHTTGSSNVYTYNLCERSYLKRYKANAKAEGLFTDTVIETIPVHLIPKLEFAQSTTCYVTYYNEPASQTNASRILHVYPETFDMNNVWYQDDRSKDSATGTYIRYNYEYRFCQKQEYLNYYNNPTYRSLFILNNDLYNVFRTDVKTTTDRRYQVGLFKYVNDNYGELVTSITDTSSNKCYSFTPIHVTAGEKYYIISNAKSNSLKNTGSWNFKCVAD